MKRELKADDRLCEKCSALACSDHPDEKGTERYARRRADPSRIYGHAVTIPMKRELKETRFYIVGLSLATCSDHPDEKGTESLTNGNSKSVAWNHHAVTIPMKRELKVLEGRTDLRGPGGMQ